MSYLVRLAAVAAFVLLLSPIHGAKAESLVARGRYLVTLGGCNDCHTPGAAFGHPNMKEELAGSEAGFFIPGLGVFVPPNITPDKATGIGNWTKAQIVTAITTGKRPDGRILAPVMPWRGLSHLTHRDALAIATYLKSLPPIHHAVSGPFGPGQKVTTFVRITVPAAVFDHLPKPPHH